MSEIFNCLVVIQKALLLISEIFFNCLKMKLEGGHLLWNLSGQTRWWLKHTPRPNVVFKLAGFCGIASDLLIKGNADWGKRNMHRGNNFHHRPYFPRKQTHLCVWEQENMMLAPVSSLVQQRPSLLKVVRHAERREPWAEDTRSLSLVSLHCVWCCKAAGGWQWGLRWMDVTYGWVVHPFVG